MTKKPFIYTKQTLIKKLKEISANGWILNARRGNHGGIGNTLEDLLGIKENNLSMPNAAERSDRGFMVVIDKKERKILISFNAEGVDVRHKDWLALVEKRIGLGELNPQPYWGFDDLEHKAGTKLLNAFYVQAEVKIERKKEYYRYTKITMLQKFSFEGFLKALEEAKILLDFDARSGHNHGTKFRMRQDSLPMLYERATEII